MEPKNTFLRLLCLAFGAVCFAWGAMVYYLHYLAEEVEQHSVQTVAFADAALVLGNAVNRNGQPNPCLRSRVEASAQLYNAGKVRVLIMSGGTDNDGNNEAEAMRDIAVSLGIPSSYILLESRSENTYENIMFSAPLLKNSNKIILVSESFHLPRAEWFASRLWPRKKIQSYAGEGCVDSRLHYTRKLMRESLAWGKALLLY
ncbi:MAG: YdcF family protein [Neisseria sp.]|uniref:YdcF family protein n=1 Tax=Neisseria sp. TaxID=192066 RepID=UPI0026DAC98D|nr:YdcF family protein [Neisseria sp.]MDO4640627.1 YdcF family protein [Neisseria sp.]